jgi:hypothetical protein
MLRFKGLSNIDRCFVLRWAKKLKATKLLGGKCIECGNANIFNIEFHHVDGEEKEHGISHMIKEGKKWSSILKEVKKCILLCRNCHAKKHNPNKTKSDETKRKIISAISSSTLCNKCGVEFDNLSVLEFHHTQGGKEFGVSRGYSGNLLQMEIDKIIIEAKKCILLCRNCHGIIHANIEKFERLKSFIEEESTVLKENAVIDDTLIKIAIKLREDGFTIREVAKKIGCSKSAIYSKIKELKQ